MTREEAIKYLHKLYGRADMTDEYGDMTDTEPYEQALNMAMKALQEPMRDATPEERESVDKYVKSISKLMGVDFWNLEQEPCDKHIKEIDHLRKYISKLETQIIEQESTDRIEYGTDGNAYKLWISNGKEYEPSGELISREDTLTAFADYVGSGMSMDDYDALWNIVTKMPSVNPQEPKTGHWMRKTKVDGVYDIAGVKTWGIKCQCDKCDFTTTVIEDFGYYKYCPNCGFRMIPPQEERDKEC